METRYGVAAHGKKVHLLYSIDGGHSVYAACGTKLNVSYRPNLDGSLSFTRYQDAAQADIGGCKRCQKSRIMRSLKYNAAISLPKFLRWVLPNRTGAEPGKLWDFIGTGFMPDPKECTHDWVEQDRADKIKRSWECKLCHIVSVWDPEKATVENFIRATGITPDPLHRCDYCGAEVGYDGDLCNECINETLDEKLIPSCRIIAPRPEPEDNRELIIIKKNGYDECSLCGGLVNSDSEWEGEAPSGRGLYTVTYSCPYCGRHRKVREYEGGGRLISEDEKPSKSSDLERAELKLKTVVDTAIHAIDDILTYGPKLIESLEDVRGDLYQALTQAKLAQSKEGR